MVRILLIDDNETDRHLVRHELGRVFDGLVTQEVRDQGELDRVVQAGEFDLAVTDYQLHWSNGVSVLRAVKARHPDCPVVMFTGTGNEEVAVKAMKAGLDDYVVKSPRHAIRLVTAVRSALEKAEACRRAAEAERERGVLLRRERAARAEAERLLKEARESDRRKDEFLAMLAHELRNPLAPLRNGLEILKGADADPAAAASARAILERQVTHLTRIVDDLLDVSRIQRGRVTLRPERLDLGRLTRLTAEDHRAAFEGAGLALSLEVLDVPVWVQADATRLVQVVGNLLQNATRFTDRGGRVTVRVEADARRQAVLSVRDTGVGIDPDMLPHLFGPFTQADHSLDRSKGGLGLGLALVKGLTELHGGSVDASSAGPGRGAEFVVRLPLQLEPAVIDEMPSAPQGGQARRLRILVVEDNQDAADSLKLLLEMFGHEVSVAYTGPAGVQAAAGWKPDVVLCDIGLPGLDGYGVASRLRREPATAAVRFIAITGYGQEEDRRRSGQAGFNHHLTKPVSPAELLRLLAAQ